MNNDEFENNPATNITDVSNKYAQGRQPEYALTESKDLVSLAIDESGLEQQNWTLPKLFGTNLRSQSFTCLMADLRQDKNRVSSFRKCCNGTFP